MILDCTSQVPQIVFLNSITKYSFLTLAIFKVPQMLEKLINFLRSELDISLDEISLAKRTQNIEPNTLPIVLWQYGFLDIKQLERVFDWLEVS